jgi:hypothetical protein
MVDVSTKTSVTRAGLLTPAVQAPWARYVPGQYSSGSVLFVSTRRGVANDKYLI